MLIINHFVARTDTSCTSTSSSYSSSWNSRGRLVSSYINVWYIICTYIFGTLIVGTFIWMRKCAHTFVCKDEGVRRRRTKAASQEHHINKCQTRITTNFSQWLLIPSPSSPPRPSILCGPVSVVEQRPPATTTTSVVVVVVGIVVALGHEIGNFTLSQYENSDVADVCCGFCCCTRIAPHSPVHLKGDTALLLLSIVWSGRRRRRLCSQCAWSCVEEKAGQRMRSGRLGSLVPAKWNIY